MARRIEELPVFTKAMEFWTAVDAILDRPSLRRNRKLWDQISDANDSITANMREGFEQSSDDGFANYLVYAKGSVAEVVTRLHSARAKRVLTDDELSERVALGEELGKMLGGFIKYLRRCRFKDRGTYKVGNQKVPAGPPTKAQVPRTRT
jgi:four helix bundle protein